MAPVKTVVFRAKESFKTFPCRTWYVYPKASKPRSLKTRIRSKDECMGSRQYGWCAALMRLVDAQQD